MKDFVTVVSVFFRPVTANRPYAPMVGTGGFSTTFHIDGCKMGEHKTLKVSNHLEHVYVGNKNYANVPVYAEGINGLAFDLVQEWSEHVIGIQEGGPGILSCAGDEPTPEEVDRCMKRQIRWADHLCTNAEIEWINGRKGNIDSLAREAAAWLGRAAEYEWVSDRGNARPVFCPMCSKSIDGRAVMCPHCSSVVDFDRYQQYLDKMEQLKGKLAAAGITPPAALVATIPPPVKNPQQQKSA